MTLQIAQSSSGPSPAPRPRPGTALAVRPASAVELATAPPPVHAVPAPRPLDLRSGLAYGASIAGFAALTVLAIMIDGTADMETPHGARLLALACAAAALFVGAGGYGHHVRHGGTR